MSDLFAIATNSGESRLMSIDVGGAVQPVASLGGNFGGGLAYRPASRNLWAINQGAAQPTLCTISLAGKVQAVGPLPAGMTGGLTYDRGRDCLFGITQPSAGSLAKLYQIGLDGGHFELFNVGDGTWGGLVFDRLRDRFYALQTDATQFTWIFEINLTSGSSFKRFGVGMRANGGLAYALHQDTYYFAGRDDSSDPSDYLHTLRQNGEVRQSMQLGPGFESASMVASPWFGGTIGIFSPLQSERFVSAEPVHLDGRVFDASGIEVSDSTGLTWTSDVDGVLGTGPLDHTLSVGTHALSLAGHGISRSVAVRVFADLGELYSARPAPGELERIQTDFTINWIDGPPGDPTQAWTTYPGFPFDQSSTDPSRTAVLAKLDVLRHQRFSEQPPFSEGKSLYDYVKSYTHTINVNLSTAVNDAFGGVINLNRNFTLWANSYVDSLYLFVHENRHNQPGDPNHTTCTAWTGAAGVQNGMDRTFEPGSGYAYATLYLMWVYKYSRFDTATMRAHAKGLVSIFKDRFCTRPSSTNALVQALLVELFGV